MTPDLTTLLTDKLDEIRQAQSAQAVSFAELNGKLDTLSERVSNALNVQAFHANEIRELKEGKADAKVVERVTALERKVYLFSGGILGIQLLLTIFSIWRFFQ